MLKVILMAFVFSSASMLHAGEKKVLDTFIDQVKKVSETSAGVELYFEIHAAFYIVKKQNPKFIQMKSELEKSIIENKKVSVLVEVPAMEIIQVN